MTSKFSDQVRALSSGLRDRVPAPLKRHANGWGAGMLLLVALLSWYLFFYSPAAPPAKSGPPVRVARVGTHSVDVTENQIGTVIAVATVQVTAQVSGQLLSAEFREGQIVHAGDVIFRIDPKPFLAALAQAEAVYERDEANLINAERDKERFVTLAAQGAASAQQRDQAVATADADAATVKSDKAAVDAAKINLGYTIIRSPITGKTGPILIQPGNLVQANNAAAPLVVITQLQPIKVSFFVPQSELPKLQDRMREGKLVATVAIHGAADTQIGAPVDFIGNQVTSQTGTIELRAAFPNTDNRLVPGQLLDVKVTVADLPNAMVVPHEAINLGPASRYVYVVDKHGVAQLRTVDVLFDDGTTAAVEGPVKAGDTVITEGQLRVAPGAPVTVVGSPQGRRGRNKTAPSIP